MSFNWTEYLFLAQELTSKSTTSPIQEAHLRSIRNIVDYKDTFHGNLLGRTQAVLIEAEEVIRLIGTL